MRKRLRALVLLIGLLPMAAWAGLNHNEVRRLREQGRIVPLARILREAARRQPGRVIEVGVDKERQRYIYDVEVLDRNGQVWLLRFDAATGAFLGRRKD